LFDDFGDLLLSRANYEPRPWKLDQRPNRFIPAALPFTLLPLREKVAAEG